MLNTQQRTPDALRHLQGTQSVPRNSGSHLLHNPLGKQRKASTASTVTPAPPLARRLTAPHPELKRQRSSFRGLLRGKTNAAGLNQSGMWGNSMRMSEKMSEKWMGLGFEAEDQVHLVPQLPSMSVPNGG